MPLDPSIPLGYKPPESPVNQLAKILQLRGLQQDQDLNQLKADAYRRTQDRQNQLLGLTQGWDANTTDDQRSSSLKNSGFFDEADKLEQGLVKRKEVEAKAGKEVQDVKSKQFEFLANVLRDVKDQPGYDRAYQLAGLFGMKMDGVPAAYDPIFVQRAAQAFTTQAQAWANQRDMERNAESQRHNKSTEAITVRGQDVSAATSRRGQDLTDARAREANDIQKQGQRTQIVNDPNQGILLVDKGTGAARPATMNGQPVPGEATAKKVAGAKESLLILNEADKLIDQATGSYLGVARDATARSVGQATEGAQAIAKLKVLESRLMSAQPRMEGPQSNLDVQMYREAAGQIGDPTVPGDMKKAALATIRTLNEKYAAGTSVTAPQRTVTRTGTHNGRKVIQYSDGSIEYGN